MEAIVELKLNSNTKRIIATLVEGVEFSEINFKRPNATDANWVLKTKMLVSADNILNISCMVAGIPLQRSNAVVTVKYRTPAGAKEKTENVDPDTFSKKLGILIFNVEMTLS